MSYGDLLRDPRWQRKRLEILDAGEWRCCGCYRGDKTLNVHHRKYRSGAMPWEYDNTELQVLCETCHARVHDYRKKLHAMIDELGPFVLGAVLGYALSNHQNVKREPVDVSDDSVAKGVADSVGVFVIGAHDGRGGFELVKEKADENGFVDPKALNDELWEWWRVTGNAWEEEKKSKKAG